MVGTVAIASRPGTNATRHAIGDLFLVRGTYNGPNPYTANGDPVTAADFGFSTAHEVVELILLDTVGGSEFAVYDFANKKIKLFTADGTEVAGAANASGQQYRFLALIA